VGSSPLNLDWVVIPLVRGATVLDVGCGYGRWASLLRTNYWEAGLSAPPQVNGVDGFAPNVEAAKGLGVYRRVWHQMLPGPLDGTWDTVLACEIIEHLQEDHVSAMLDLLEGVALRRVIVSTPNGAAYREGRDTTHGFNELEAHRSYVPESLLRKRGYRLRGVGFGPPASRLAKIADRTHVGRDLASLSLHIPALGASYVAYKDVG
jgi:2-polyprenyl-3-methyl-5-hydroxy-6-metoxy-1,4-benzoquinol methylase